MKALRVVDSNPLSIVDIQRVRKFLLTPDRRVTFYENNCSDVMFIVNPELTTLEVEALSGKFTEYKISVAEKSVDDLTL